MIIDPYTFSTLTITSIAAAASDAVSVILKKPAGYQYVAGQYAIAKIHVSGSPILRQYSFASSPDDDFLELLVQKEPNGTASTWFHQTATVGDTIDISQAFGSFTLRGSTNHSLFIAGRIGVAPFISMIRDTLSHNQAGQISLLYSARGEDQFCHRDLLEAVATTFIDTTKSHRIDAGILGPKLSDTTDVYICGSKQFADSITQQLAELGVSNNRIHRELFTLQ